MDHDGPSALKAVRQQDNLKQREFADRIGKSRSLVCEWEGGTRHPSFADALELERFFGKDEQGEPRLPVEAWGYDRETARRRPSSTAGAA